MKRIGWIGYSDGQPYFEKVIDDYVKLRGGGEGQEPAVYTVNVYRNKREARKRFEDVRPAFVK